MIAASRAAALGGADEFRIERMGEQMTTRIQAAGTILIIVSAACVASCLPAPPGEALGTFEVRGSYPPPDQNIRSFFVLDDVTTSAAPATLYSVAYDMTEVRYRVGQEHRPFLFDGDLQAGITGGNYLQLPQLAPAETLRTIDLGPFEGTKWGSFRIYDTGLCSALAPWPMGGIHGTLLVPPMAPLITSAFDGALAGAANCNQRFFRIQPAEVSVVLHGNPSYNGIDTPDDRIRFSSVYRAQSAGLAGSECSPVHLTLVVEFGFEAVPGTFASAPQCAAPDATPVQGTTDFRGVVYSVDAQVHGFCSVGGVIQDMVRAQLDAQLPDLVGAAVRNALLVDPVTFFGLDSVPTRSCACPEDCDSRAPNGPAWPRNERHSCVGGRCFIQLEPRRLNVRPEGLEVVIVPRQSDPQYDLFALAPAIVRDTLCAVGRNSVAATLPDTTPPEERALGFPIVIRAGVTPDSNQCP